MNVGVITIDFEEAGLLHDGEVYGSFMGSAEVDCDGKVVALCLDICGGGKPYWHLDVPATYDKDNWVCNLADMIQGTHKHTIKDALDDWSVSIAEQQWEPREAAE